MGMRGAEGTGGVGRPPDDWMRARRRNRLSRLAGAGEATGVCALALLPAAASDLR